MTHNEPTPALHVGLFITCLTNFNRPNIGFASVKLLQDAGCKVSIPQDQTCCGQPNYNSGDRQSAQNIAMAQIALLEPYDYVVAPSGSCAGMIARHYPRLFADDTQWGPRAEALANKTFEITQFLTSVCRQTTTNATYHGLVVLHDSCSGLRELGVKHAPRKLLNAVDGLTLVELQTPEACCGFGGTFCVKYPDISNVMVTRKIDDVIASGATTLSAGDWGCLMNMAGKLHRMGHNMHVFHVTEILANMAKQKAPHA
ncbi:MAG: (Fe-S)-binding protein [Pseudomonadota bacterium]